MNKNLEKSTINRIILFSFVLVFFSTTAVPREGNFYNDIGKFFHTGLFHIKFFTPFELIVIILLFNLFNIYIVQIKVKFLFVFAFLVYLIRMFNPNSDTLNPIFGLPLLSNISEYTFLFLLLVFVNLSTNLSKIVIEKIYNYTLVFSTIRAIILIIVYYFGNVTTVRWGKYSVILDEIDTQFLFSFMGAMVLVFFLLEKKRNYFYVFLLLMGITFLSVQRTTALPGLISVFFIILFSLVKRIPVIALKSFAIPILVFIAIVFSAIQFPDSKIAFAMNRFLGTVQQSETQRKEFSDTGHFEQSALTFAAAVKENVFFGVGYGKFDNLYLEGQTVNIHNAYASTWAHHGILSLVFYLTIIIIVIRKTIKLMYFTNKHNYKYYLPKLAASLYLLGYFFVAWFAVEGVFNAIRNQVFWLLIFIFITNDPETSKNKIIYERNY